MSKKLGELRMAQIELARMTGINKNTVNLYYNEMTDRVNLEHLDLICEALNCDLSEILKFTPNKIPKITHNKNGSEKVFK